MDAVDLTSSGVMAGTLERGLHPVQGAAQRAAGDGSLAVSDNPPAAASGDADQRSGGLGRIVGKGTLVDTLV